MGGVCKLERNPNHQHDDLHQIHDGVEIHNIQGRPQPTMDRTVLDTSIEHAVDDEDLYD